MKLLKIEIKGIAMHENTVININKPLTVLFGDVQNGKTTILNAVRWGLGCIVPDNVIKDGCTEGEIFLAFDNATSRRAFYKAKDGSEVARPLEYIENGKLVKEPIKYLKTKVNPFLLNNEYFMQMSLTEQMKFFVALFGVDTTVENKLIATAEEANKILRIEIKAAGDINPISVEKPNLEALLKEKEGIVAENVKVQTAYDGDLALALVRTSDITRAHEDLKTLEAQMEDLIIKIGAKRDWISNNPPLPAIQTPLFYDVTNVEARISNAKADDVLYQQYVTECAKLAAKQKKEEELKSGELALKAAKEAKTAKLSGYSEKTGIDGLLFIDGGYTYDGVAFDMLSTSGRISLSEKLSALFPSDFSVDLIDRAESLGKRNLINLANLAALEGRTIIATVVSDEFATDSENVGVFKVSDGNVE